MNEIYYKEIESFSLDEESSIIRTKKIKKSKKIADYWRKKYRELINHNHIVNKEFFFP